MQFQFVSLDMLVLSHGEQRAEIDTSYPSDSPSDLLGALVLMMRGSDEERVVFEGEPGRTVLRLRRLGGHLVRIEVSGGPGDDADPSGPPWFRHTEPLARFAGRVHDEFARLRREVGPEGHQRGWGIYGFPERPFRELARLLEL
ncbi:MAG TPA: hypothetical protein VGV85_03410 [Longimicrobiaceae bacterium]|nr:hypothetical protein [Longimicrobiaceae bacterium]